MCSSLVDQSDRTTNRCLRGQITLTNMEQSVGSLQEQALKRKERLKALKSRKLQGRDDEEGEPERKRALAEEAEEKH
ncbi:unnamed protein product, partial [Arctogadus glacialis]